VLGREPDRRERVLDLVRDDARSSTTSSAAGSPPPGTGTHTTLHSRSSPPAERSRRCTGAVPPCAPASRRNDSRPSIGAPAATCAIGVPTSTPSIVFAAWLCSITRRSRSSDTTAVVMLSIIVSITCFSRSRSARLCATRRAISSMAPTSARSSGSLGSSPSEASPRAMRPVPSTISITGRVKPAARRAPTASTSSSSATVTTTTRRPSRASSMLTASSCASSGVDR
jgi:hypothetical protein